MNQTNIVILGGGMVAGYAAKQLLELGLPRGELAILSPDNTVPYKRPPPSKSFLAGKGSEAAIKINPEGVCHQEKSSQGHHKEQMDHVSSQPSHLRNVQKRQRSVERSEFGGLV